MSPFERGVSGNPSGRPKKPAAERRVRLTVVIAPETREWIQAQSIKRGKSQGVIVDELVQERRTRK